MRNGSRMKANARLSPTAPLMITAPKTEAKTKKIRLRAARQAPLTRKRIAVKVIAMRMHAIASSSRLLKAEKAMPTTQSASAM